MAFRINYFHEVPNINTLIAIVPILRYTINARENAQFFNLDSLKM